MEGSSCISIHISPLFGYFSTAQRNDYSIKNEKNWIIRNKEIYIQNIKYLFSTKFYFITNQVTLIRLSMLILFTYPGKHLSSATPPITLLLVLPLMYPLGMWSMQISSEHSLFDLSHRLWLKRDPFTNCDSFSQCELVLHPGSKNMQLKFTSKGLALKVLS